MNLRILLLFHCVVTLAAGIVLIVFPEAIPATVNIKLQSDQYLLCYFLAAAELGVAFLSFFSRRVTDKYALKIISGSFIVFHATTGLLELFALNQGVTTKIIGNIILRIVIVILFWYYGFYHNKSQEKHR